MCEPLLREHGSGRIPFFGDAILASPNRRPHTRGTATVRYWAREERRGYGNRLLREFTVLARQLNYREAAAELHLSQSTLSRHITALEALYGVPLFQRDRHAVHLTDAGVFLLDYAKGIWDQYSLSREHMQRLFAGEHLLRISGVIGHPSLYPCIRDAESLLHDIDPTVTLRIERNASAVPGDQIDELDNDGRTARSCFRLSTTLKATTIWPSFRWRRCPWPLSCAEIILLPARPPLMPPCWKAARSSN